MVTVVFEDVRWGVGQQLWKNHTLVMTNIAIERCQLWLADFCPLNMVMFDGYAKLPKGSYVDEHKKKGVNGFFILPWLNSHKGKDSPWPNSQVLFDVEQRVSGV